MAKSPVALDIETVGQEWGTLAAEVQNYLLERARSDEQREVVPNKLGLHPGTGRIVAIGLWYPDEDRGLVLVEGDAPGWSDWGAHARIFHGDESAVLREFWKVIADSSGTVVTFYGRPFDAPYLMIRSAILAVEPTRNLVPYRYSLEEHCDLADVLSFWNARRIAGHLDFWCRQFGIESPKADIQGTDVATLYKERRLEDIARYCLGDARAIARLYVRLNTTTRHRRAWPSPTLPIPAIWPSTGARPRSEWAKYRTIVRRFDARMPAAKRSRLNVSL